MHFQRHKSEHLAEHLRVSIVQGELSEPLPTLRDWSERLGVSSDTLQTALKILKREGWIGSRPRKGFYLARKPVSRARLKQPPVVRWISYRRDEKNPVVAEILGAIQQKLAIHHVGFNVEICDDLCVKAIRKEKARAHEVFLIINLSQKHLGSLAKSRNALLLGSPSRSTQLPYITVDVYSAFRHAVFLLCRRGFHRISLVNIKSKHQHFDADQLLAHDFLKICSLAPRPVTGEVIWLPNNTAEQYLVVERLALKVRERHGFITNAPVSPGLLMMALMSHGLKIPEQTEVVAVNCPRYQALTFPALTYYPYPLERICKTVYQAANHYFTEGILPPLHKVIPLTMVSQI